MNSYLDNSTGLTPGEKSDLKTAGGLALVLFIVAIIAAMTETGQAILESLNSSNLP